MWCHDFLPGTSPTCKGHPFLCLSFSVCAHGNCLSFPTSKSSTKAAKQWRSEKGRCGEYLLPTKAGWCSPARSAGAWALLVSGALDSSDSWGFGLPRADHFSPLLNSSAGKSTPEPPAKCWAAAPGSKQQHPAHTAQLQTLPRFSSSKSQAEFVPCSLQRKTSHVHSGKHKHGEVVWFPAKPLVYFKELKMTESYLHEYEQRSGAKEETGSNNHRICSPNTRWVFLTVPKKHIRGSREWRTTRHRLI